MSLPIENLAALAAFMKSEGICRIKLGDIEIDFGSKPVAPAYLEAPKPTEKTAAQEKAEFDALLFASSGA